MVRSVLLICLLSCLAVPVLAQSGGIRSIEATDAASILLNTKIRFTTMVTLPDGENVVRMIVGDQEFWKVESDNTNLVYVKPSKASTAAEVVETNLHLVASSGFVYSFILREGRGARDEKVNVTRTAALSLSKPTQKFYTAKEMDDVRAELDKQAEQVDLAQKLAAQSIDEFRKQYPETLRFYDVSSLPPFSIRSMWTDGTFTYAKTTAKELPAAFEMKDGKASQLNFQVRNGNTYIFPKVVADGQFVLGKQKLPFHPIGQTN